MSNSRAWAARTSSKAADTSRLMAAKPSASTADRPSAAAALLTASARYPPSRLNNIQPDGWPAAYTTERLNVLHMLGLLIELEPRQAARSAGSAPAS